LPCVALSACISLQVLTFWGINMDFARPCTWTSHRPVNPGWPWVTRNPNPWKHGVHLYMAHERAMPMSMPIHNSYALCVCLGAGLGLGLVLYILHDYIINTLSLIQNHYTYTGNARAVLAAVKLVAPSGKWLVQTAIVSLYIYTLHRQQTADSRQRQRQR
jgi:hypothetical protein